MSGRFLYLLDFWLRLVWRVLRSSIMCWTTGANKLDCICGFCLVPVLCVMFLSKSNCWSLIASSSWRDTTTDSATDFVGTCGCSVGCLIQWQVPFDRESGMRLLNGWGFSASLNYKANELNLSAKILGPPTSTIGNRWLSQFSDNEWSCLKKTTSCSRVEVGWSSIYVSGMILCEWYWAKFGDYNWGNYDCLRR